MKSNKKSSFSFFLLLIFAFIHQWLPLLEFPFHLQVQAYQFIRGMLQTRVLAHSASHDIHLHTTPLLQIRSSIKLHKVFEDESSGIVCYRDEKGEIICEGYDEGPRFHQVFSTFTNDHRDAEVIDLLHRRLLLQILDKSEEKHGAVVDKDDFNKFYH